MKKFLLAMVLPVLLSGCYTQRFPINQNYIVSEPTHSEMKMFFLWGLANQPQYTDSAKICGGLNNVGTVETKMTFLDGFIGALTFGIIAPQTSNVYCVNYGYQPQYTQPTRGYQNYPQGHSYYQR